MGWERVCVLLAEAARKMPEAVEEAKHWFTLRLLVALPKIDRFDVTLPLQGFLIDTPQERPGWLPRRLFRIH